MSFSAFFLACHMVFWNSAEKFAHSVVQFLLLVLQFNKVVDRRTRVSSKPFPQCSLFTPIKAKTYRVPGCNSRIVISLFHVTWSRNRAFPVALTEIMYFVKFCWKSHSKSMLSLCMFIIRRGFLLLLLLLLPFPCINPSLRKK